MRSHLIVAGVGSAALVGLAGTAIWMVMPSETGREILSRMESAPRIASAVAAPAPAADAEGAVPTTKARGTAPAAEAQVSDSKGDRPFSVQRPKQAPAVNPVLLDPEPLASSDPRWSQSAGKNVTAPSSELAAAQKIQAPVPGSDLVAAYISEEPAEEKPAKAKQAAKTDEATTVASVRPEKPSSDKPKKAAAKADDDDTKKAGESGTRVTQGVTMRAKPDNDGTALLTIPAKEQVQVVSCKGWCEIVYKGKRGYVYKKFLQNGGKS